MTARRAEATPALIHDWLTGMRGGEKVLEAIGELLPQAPIYTLFHFPGTVSPALESHEIHTSHLQRAPFLHRAYRNYLGFFPAAIEGFDLTDHDLVISTSHCVAKGVIPGPRARHLCYCFTPMRYAWDQEHVYFPRRRGLTARVRGQVLSRLRTWDVASAPRVDEFVTISHYVRQRIRRFYGRDAEVLHPPVDVELFTPGEGDGGGEEYCLAVAALVPYKRLDLAIAACGQLGVGLKIVGDGPDRSRLERTAGAGTELLGRVSADRLRALYRGACCVIQPGIEDFGISSVEALACGTPMVALGVGGIRDVVDDGEHGVLYDQPDDPAALAAAIDNCRELRFNLLNLRRRAEAFSKPRFCARFEQLIAGRRQEGSAS